MVAFSPVAASAAATNDLRQRSSCPVLWPGAMTITSTSSENRWISPNVFDRLVPPLNTALTPVSPLRATPRSTSVTQKSLVHVCHRYAGRPCHSCRAGCRRVGRLAQGPAHAAGTNPGRERQSSAQRARAPRWGSSFAAASRAAGRTWPSSASWATTSPSRPQPASTTAGPERSTSSTATSDGDMPASSLPTGRCVNRTCVHGAGALPGTAARYVDGICEVRPSQCAAATPAGPEPGPPSARATSSARGDETPKGVEAPFQ